jgi:cardiolipin synthase A/B
VSALSWSALIAGGFTVWGVAMGIVLVMQRRSPAATIAWLLVLSFLPVVGLGVYRLIGPQRLARRKLRRRMTRKLVEEAVGAMEEIEADSPMRQREQLARIAFAAGEAPPLRADTVEVIADGAAKYLAMAQAFESARHHIHIEYYIWENDQIGRRIRDQLVARARAGVEVRVIVDGTGSYGIRRRFFNPLVAAGGEVAWFNPISLFQIRRRRADFRSHRKLIVCDGRVGLTGGMNIADGHTSEFTGPTAWRDTHIRITGSAVRVLQRIFAEDWLFATERELPRGGDYFPTPRKLGDEVVQIVSSGPDLETFAVHKMFFAAINQASTRVWLTTPYFVPDDAVLSALVSAAMRGVDVRIIVPARGDSRLVDFAARSYFPEMLASGARMFEYQPSFIHSKTFVVDDDIAIVGTANLDNRSFRLNFEVAAVCYSQAVNAQLDTIFREDLQQCREVQASQLERLPFFTRLGQAGARLLSPLL